MKNIDSITFLEMERKDNKMSYIKEKHKRIIEELVNKRLEIGSQVHIKQIAAMLGVKEKYALYEILDYVRNDLGIDNKYIWRGNRIEYTQKLEGRGHIQLVNDLYFDRCYLHQYNICKCLDIDMEQVQKYIVHHRNGVEDNSINNLWIFQDTSSHQKFHGELKKNKDIDIKSFTLNYVDSILNKDNAEEVRQYLEILDKLINLHKKNALD